MIRRMIDNSSTALDSPSSHLHGVGEFGNLRRLSMGANVVGKRVLQHFLWALWAFDEFSRNFRATPIQVVLEAVHILKRAITVLAYLIASYWSSC